MCFGVFPWKFPFFRRSFSSPTLTSRERERERERGGKKNYLMIWEFLYLNLTCSCMCMSMFAVSCSSQGILHLSAGSRRCSADQKNSNWLLWKSKPTICKWWREEENSSFCYCWWWPNWCGVCCSASWLCQWGSSETIS